MQVDVDNNDDDDDIDNDDDNDDVGCERLQRPSDRRSKNSEQQWSLFSQNGKNKFGSKWPPDF